MHVEERAELGRRVAAGHRGVESFELVLHLAQCIFEARNFVGDAGGIDRVMRDLECGVRHELRPPDRDATRDADAVERETRHRPVLIAPRRNSRR